jgi:hypothetical protein
VIYNDAAPLALEFGATRAGNWDAFMGDNSQAAGLGWR